MVAAKHKNEEAFKHYYTLHPQALFWKNDDGMCALHFAAKSGCLNIVKVCQSFICYIGIRKNARSNSLNIFFLVHIGSGRECL